MNQHDYENRQNILFKELEFYILASEVGVALESSTDQHVFNSDEYPNLNQYPVATIHVSHDSDTPPVRYYVSLNGDATLEFLQGDYWDCVEVDGSNLSALICKHLKL